MLGRASSSTESILPNQSGEEGGPAQRASDKFSDVLSDSDDEADSAERPARRVASNDVERLAQLSKRSPLLLLFCVLDFFV